MIEQLKVLKSQILDDLQKMKQLFQKFEKLYHSIESSSEELEMIASGYYLNQIYTGFERVFYSVAKIFENNINPSEWHKDLLEKMKLNIEDIRPAVISDESFRYLNEMRAFRHFFRHGYNVEIECKKLEIVADKALKLKVLYESEIHKFIKFLDELMEDC